MVRAISEGRKSQTRRVVKPREAERLGLAMVGIAARIAPDVPYRSPVIPPGTCPFGVAGDRLWVRETWALFDRHQMAEQLGRQTPYRPEHDVIVYADSPQAASVSRWRSPIHMPRAAGRILLDVTAVRVERLQAITEADARAEGVQNIGDYQTARQGFSEVWDRLNAKRGYPWASDPWVFVIEFRRVKETP